MFFPDPKDPELHKLPWHTETCFQMSRVVRCNGRTDTRKCNVCGKEWDEPCNCDDECR